MKFEQYLLYGGVAYLGYRAFFAPKPIKEGGTIGNPITDLLTTEESTVGADGRFYFRYVGTSALRVDSNGNKIDCGVAGNPFSSSGIDGNFAKIGSAPTTYYAMFEIGTERSTMEGTHLINANKDKLKVGDRLQLTLLGGQFSAMENQIVTVIQLGSDVCNNSRQPQMMNSSIVIDFPIILEGANDSQYPPQQAFGYGVKV